MFLYVVYCFTVFHRFQCFAVNFVNSFILNFVHLTPPVEIQDRLLLLLNTTLDQTLQSQDNRKIANVALQQQ